MTNLAILGCGKIAKFHIPAMQAAGFKVTAIAGRPGSAEKLHKFSLENNLCKAEVYNDPNDLITSNNWDALLLCCSTNAMIGYINSLQNKKKPILVEKPVSYNSLSLKELKDHDHIRVAYNRRFYKTVSYAKNFVSQNENLIAKVSIPEISNLESDALSFPKRLPLKSYENSVHVIDILRYTLGNFEVIYKKNVVNEQNYLAIICIGVTETGNTIVIDSCYNAPDNFKIDYISKTKRLELKPIELAKLYDGMQIADPSEKLPIRMYSPIVIDTISEISEGNLKLGFLEQAHDFKKFCKGSISKAANINDAYEAVKLIEKFQV